MKAGLQFLVRLYGLLLILYPHGYREEYGEELLIIFNLSLGDAAKNGAWEIFKVTLNEFLSLPAAILYEHLRERRKNKMTGKFASRFDFTPGSRNETFAALAPFLFGMVMVFIGYLGKYLTVPLWMQVAFAILFWSSVLGLFLLGSAKGLPRWFMPYIGIPMPIISLLLFNSLMEKLQGVWWYRLPWFLGDFLQQGLLWVGLIGSFALLVLAVRLIPKLHPFYKRLKTDWTLMNFLLYGAVPFALVITFDDYQNEEPYMILAFLIMALGGWLYLRTDVTLNKFLFLYLGVALSMLVAAAGKAILFLSPSWPWSRQDFAWQSEAMGTIIMWLWLALIMLIPPALNLLPEAEGHPKAA